uniref:Ubiquitin-like domain-containing protein n=1 Tax=Globisporangium ultimum (strain ATCC 200006 / CBS 805.95 / DAOM BR144) TaxID=431595 RepID=K3WVP9_GLOUD
MTDREQQRVTAEGIASAAPREYEPANVGRATAEAQATPMVAAEGTSQSAASAGKVDEEETKMAAAANNAPTQIDGNDEEKMVVVHLKFIGDRERVSVRCSPTIVIADLKQKVLAAHAQLEQQQQQSDSTAAEDANREQESVSIATLRLIYKGKVMKDDHTLALYNFVHEDTIHAVFGRPQASSPSQNSGVAHGDASTATGPTAMSPATATRTSSGGVATTSVQDYGNGLRVGQISIDTDADSPLPDLGNLINSMLSSLGGSSGSLPDGATASIRIFSDPSALGPLSSDATTNSASSNLSSTSSTTVSAATTSTSTTAGPVRPTVATAPPAVTTPSTVATTDATSLLNQAASLRRLLPAMELAPLSRPPELSLEMYNLGNALREAGDTYLAVHRQLQFVVTRFLSENNLNESERLRLRTRVHQLVPILEHIASMSRAVARNLDSSSYYGPGSQTPTTSGVSEAPAASSVSTPTAPSPAATTASAPPPSDPSVNVSPTVNIFGGGNGHAGGIAGIGSSIAEILQAVNNFRPGNMPPSGAPTTAATSDGTTTSTAQDNSAGGLGGLLNLVSTLTGARPVQPAAPRPSTSVSSAPATSSQPSANFNQPLSDLFAQVMHDMDTLDEWDPEVTEQLLKR